MLFCSFQGAFDGVRRRFQFGCCLVLPSLSTCRTRQRCATATKSFRTVYFQHYQPALLVFSAWSAFDSVRWRFRFGCYSVLPTASTYRTRQNATKACDRYKNFRAFYYRLFQPALSISSASSAFDSVRWRFRCGCFSVLPTLSAYGTRRKHATAIKTSAVSNLSSISQRYQSLVPRAHSTASADV